MNSYSYLMPNKVGTLASKNYYISASQNYQDSSKFTVWFNRHKNQKFPWSVCRFTISFDQFALETWELFSSQFMFSFMFRDSFSFTEIL